MKRIVLNILAVVLVAVLFSNALPVLAVKPTQVITVSNGFPSGMHFNLNIHGKNPETFTTPSPPYDPAKYGNSIFIPEYSEPYAPITIQCVSNKNSGTGFVVIDPYAMPSLYNDGVTPTNFENADDLAQFNLPYKIQTDTGVINTNGYYVYGRILGTPKNSNNDGEPSSIIVTPSPILQVDSEGITFPLGLITQQGSYKLQGQEFTRFDDTSSFNGKGKSATQNITDMFMWTGWIFDASLDTNVQSDGILDRVIDLNDVPADQDGDTDIDENDLALWLESLEADGQARYYEDWWVFDVADMVTQSWDIENDGTKLLQIRFYPVATTTFTEKAHIVVKKITDPVGDPATLFDFEASYCNPWQMTSNQFCLSHGLEPGPYSVTELAEDGWDLTDILIEDPTGGSSVADSTVNIDLAEGETVIITFVNTQRGQIIVDKVTDPTGDPQLFNFTLTGGPDAIDQAFQLADATTPYESGVIKPGTYSVTETIPAEWDLTEVICSDGSLPTNIILNPGEIITVTYFNDMHPTSLSYGTQDFPDIDPVWEVVDTWTGDTGENQARAICSDGMYLYVGLMTSPGKVKKIDPSTMTVVGTWTGVTNQDQVYGLAWDGTNLYAAINSDSTIEASLIKIDVSDMTTVSNWRIPSGGRARSVLWDGSTYLYVGDNVNPGHVYQIDPATMSTVAAWESTTGLYGIYALAFDGTFVYAGGQAISPTQVSQIETAGMTTVATWTGAEGENKADSLLWDGQNLYCGTDSLPGYVIKIDTSDMTTISRWDGVNQDYAFSMVYLNPYLYVGIEGPNGTGVVTLDPSTMLQVDGWETDGVAAQNCITADADFIYFGQTVTPAKVYKLNPGSIMLG